MLRELFDKHECDKGSLKHRYDRVYEPALQDLQDKEFNLLEIGILRGDSIKSWLDFFPLAQIYCIDIFVQIPPEDISVLEHPRVNWCCCDSIEGINADFKKMVLDEKFDVIIDDGLHRPTAMQKTFKNFIPYLKNGGQYFIEDVWPLDVMSEEELKHPWLKTKSEHYTAAQHEELLKTLNNFKVVSHDLRKEYFPDTYIIEIIKNT